MRQATVVGACAVYAAYCLVVGSAGIRTSPDTVFYLSFSPVVPTGYPVFLRLFGQGGAVVLQPLIFAGAVGWLALEALRSWSSLPLALALIAGCLAAPQLPALHASVLTESLFMSGEVMLLASMVRFARQPEWRTAVTAAAMAGMAATIRNAGYAFVPVLVVMTILYWRRIGSLRVATLAAAVLPVVAFASAERAIARMVNGDEATSLLGRHLFAKAALIEAPRATPPLDPARTVIEDHLEHGFSLIRRTIDDAPPNIRSLLTVYYETCLQGPCMREMRETSIAWLPEAKQNTILVDVALQRIAKAPLNFARLTLLHYVSLWMAYKQEHPNTTPVLNEFLRSHHPLPYESLAFSWREPNRVLQFEPDPRVRILQPAVIAIAWVTGGLAVIGLAFATFGKTLPPLLTMAALAALTAHAGVLFSATFAPGISRFTVSFWPAVMSAIVFGGWFVIREARPSGAVATRS